MGDTTNTEESEGSEGLAIRERLRPFAPSLIDYLGLKDKEWENVAQKLKLRNEALEPHLQIFGEAAVKTTIYDLVVETLLGNKIAMDFLSYIDHVAFDLRQLLPDHLQTSARQQARDLFLNLNNNAAFPFLEKVGELSAIAYVLKTTGAKPLQFEVKFVPGKKTSLDLFVEMHSGSVPIEVLNVWIDDSKIIDAQGLHSFLNYRIEKKIKEKLGKALPAANLPFPLLLVLWFQDVKTVAKYAQEIINRAHGNELPACVLQQYTDPDGKHWIFASITSLASSYKQLLTE